MLVPMKETFFSEITWLIVWIISMIRCLSYRNVMSDKVYKRKIQKFLVHKIMFNCFQSVLENQRLPEQLMDE